MRVLRNFYSLPSVKEIVVFDLDAHKINSAKNDFPKVRVAESVESIMQSDVNGIVIVTAPTETHYQLGKQALSSGKHVWLEKPLTCTLREARDLIELARQKKLQLHVDHTLIYSVPMSFVSEVLTRGELGTVRSISMVRCNAKQLYVHRDVFWDLAYHDLSILLFLFKGLPRLIDVQKDFLSNVVCHGRLNLKYTSGIDVTIEVGRVSPEKVRMITTTGSNGMLVYNDLDGVAPIKIYDTDGRLVAAPRLDLKEPLLTQAEQFVACVERNIQSKTNGETDLEIIALLEQISGEHDGALATNFTQQ